MIWLAVFVGVGLLVLLLGELLCKQLGCIDHRESRRDDAMGHWD
jgi:hypothetical protein